MPQGTLTRSPSAKWRGGRRVSKYSRHDEWIVWVNQVSVSADYQHPRRAVELPSYPLERVRLAGRPVESLLLHLSINLSNVSTMIRTSGSQTIFKAVADPSRRRLLDLLLERDIAAQELASHFEMSFPAVSQHLSVLLKAGLVTRRSQGRQRVYCAPPHGLQAIQDWTAKYQRFWSGRLRSLGQYLDRHDKSSRS